MQYTEHMAALVLPREVKVRCGYFTFSQT